MDLVSKVLNFLNKADALTSPFFTGREVDGMGYLPFNTNVREFAQHFGIDIHEEKNAYSNGRRILPNAYFGSIITKKEVYLRFESLGAKPGDRLLNSSFDDTYAFRKIVGLSGKERYQLTDKRAILGEQLSL